MGRDNRIRYSLSLTVLLLVVCLVLSTGTAFGRFRTKLDPFEYWFRTEASGEISLRGLDEAGELTSLPSSWSIDSSGTALAFGVSNESASEDQNFALQVLVSGNVRNGASLTMELISEDGGEVFTAKAMRIQQGTELYEEFGAGWIYRFLDEEERELTWTLEGGQLSVFRGELLCAGVVTEESSGLMQLQVIAGS